MVGEYLIESLARVPVECEFASELRYRNLPMTRDTLVFVISQSGETADTLAALRESQPQRPPHPRHLQQRRQHHRPRKRRRRVHARRPGNRRRRDQVLHLPARPSWSLLSCSSAASSSSRTPRGSNIIGRTRGPAGQDRQGPRTRCPDRPDREKIRAARRASSSWAARRTTPSPSKAPSSSRRSPTSPPQDYPSAELKHGIIALVSEDTPSVFIAPHDAVFEKNLSNIEEVKARKGPVIAIGTEGCDALKDVADDVILLPKAPEYLTPDPLGHPLQLLAYHISVELGCDVDKPRNLAKSVTVE